ncbi:response regulator [Aestuariivirga sp.]|uniref:response regulator n=1 Tax=Aestuariivirga sp. TaxID=2650926 RepID=UPI00359442F5
MTIARSTILVVEDESLIRMSAVDLTISAGFRAVEAKNADEAIGILEARHDIHLVFTDVDMPGSMDGLKLCHHIRDRWPPVKLLVASGKTVVAESQLPDGAMFFSKPYSNTSIVEAMTRLLAA